MSKKPVVIDLAPKTKTVRKSHKITPADAPVVPDLDNNMPRQNTSMEVVTELAARKPSRMMRLFLWLIVTLAGLVISIAFWDFVTGLMQRNIWLGRAALTLIVLFVLCLLFFAFRELAAFVHLRRMDGLKAASKIAYASGDMQKVRAYSDRLKRLYSRRQNLRWAFGQFDEQSISILDADAYMMLIESTILVQLDKLVKKEIETTARQVATATAIIPLAFADIVVALTANIRMIRRIAEIYGGRSGAFGSWRLMKAVATHLVATGAVAVGDDMIGTLAGGGILSKLSRRFGEGIINGALTARVGVAAMDVCRPMGYYATKRPSVSALMKNALVGFVSRES